MAFTAEIRSVLFTREASFPNSPPASGDAVRSAPDRYCNPE